MYHLLDSHTDGCSQLFVFAVLCSIWYMRKNPTSQSPTTSISPIFRRNTLQLISSPSSVIGFRDLTFTNSTSTMVSQIFKLPYCMSLDSQLVSYSVQELECWPIASAVRKCACCFPSLTPSVVL